LVEIGAGERADRTIDVYPSPVAKRRVAFRRARVRHLLGTEVPERDITRILSALGFSLSPHADGWVIEVPSYRVDVTREADLIEEVGRHWGFDRIPATFPALTSVPRPNAAGVTRGRRVRHLLTSAGLQEAVTFTFIEQSAAAPFSADGAAVAIAK